MRYNIEAIDRTNAEIAAFHQSLNRPRYGVLRWRGRWEVYDFDEGRQVAVLDDYRAASRKAHGLNVKRRAHA